jgi:hypothetical protein
MANSNYNDVEIPQEMMDALDGKESTNETTVSPEQTTVESSTEANETVVEDKHDDPVHNEVTEEVDRFDGFELEGERFSRDDVISWMQDSANKEAWQKSNTEKAQNLSQWNKLADRINNDDAFRTHIKDFFFENEGEAASLGLDGSLDFPEAPAQPEIPSELEERLNNLEGYEVDRVMEQRVDNLDGTLSNLEQQYPDILGDQDKVWEFLDFADRNAELYVENGMPNLERAFREWSYDSMQERLNHYKKLDNNNNRNTAIINTSEGGAKEVKADNKVKSWNDVTMDNPEIAKFFND